ncbi:MAG: B12-binding domain-containing radical SAM protein [Planctomycetes bacterium]|nr:B12-binding domain-containing radical SAM protein [Planctomycetota bacterium]
MRVLFVYTFEERPIELRRGSGSFSRFSEARAKPLPFTWHTHLGVSYLASFLQANGCETEILVLSTSLDKELDTGVIDGVLDRFDPRLVCYTSVQREYSHVVRIAKYVKSRREDVFNLAGGPHIQLAPEQTIQDFDAICLGEGECPTLELVGQLKEGKAPSGIRNLWFRRGSEIEKNPTREFMPDLDSLPFPDRKMWDPWIEFPGFAQQILVSRGCPFQCTYCCNHAFQKISEGKYVRFRSPENVMREIEHIVETIPIATRIYFESETFNVRTDYCLRFCQHLERLWNDLGRRIDFGTNMRITPRCDHAELYSAMSRAGFSFINIGLESGSERIRKFLKRYYSNADLLRSVGQAQDRGLAVNLYVMIGIPGETYEDYKETLELVKGARPRQVYLSVCNPYAGTELRRAAEEMGLLSKDHDDEASRGRITFDLPGFPRDQIMEEYRMFHRRVGLADEKVAGAPITWSDSQAAATA